MKKTLQEIPKKIKEIPLVPLTGNSCNMINMKIGDRIREAREKMGLSQSELARKLGVKPPSVQEWEMNETSPRRHRRKKLAEILEVTEEWLEFGTIASAEILREAPSDPYIPASSLDDKYVFIPRYEAGISAGHGYHNGDHVEVSKTHAYRWDWIRKNGWRPEDLCVIEASGHSMEPRISDGDVLLVNMADKEFQSGKVYVLSFPHEGLRAKRIHRLADGRIKISSDNPDKASFPDEYYSPEEASHLNIVGRVVQRGGDI